MNILALHEILHETKRHRKTRVALKLEFKKTYDKVHWGFLLQCLEIRGFNPSWCAWIKSVLKNDTDVVKVNNSIGPYFLSHKGQEGGSPIPILFNIVADVLTRMDYSAQHNNLVTGLVSNLIPNGIAILQYVDDTIFMFVR
jgi:hypothetical protein